MKDPRNEVDAHAVMHPVERRGIKFAAHMHPDAAVRIRLPKRRKPLTFWQRLFSAFK